MKDKPTNQLLKKDKLVHSKVYSSKGLMKLDPETEKRFDDQLPPVDGHVRDSIFINPYKKDVDIKDVFYHEDGSKRTCHVCAEAISDPVEQGYYKYPTGQEICCKCEPKMRLKRLEYRNRRIKDFIAQEKKLSRQEGIDSVYKAIDNHADKIVEQIEKQETLNAGDAVDLTSKALQISKVRQGLENIKLSIKQYLTNKESND